MVDLMFSELRCGEIYKNVLGGIERNGKGRERIGEGGRLQDLPQRSEAELSRLRKIQDSPKIKLPFAGVEVEL